jgi:UDP-glucose 4-epimerase
VKKIVFSSSASVYGGTKHTLNPVLFYGAGKLACEHLIKVYASKHGLSYWTYRFGNVVGSRMNHGVILDFLNQIKDYGEIQMKGDGSQVRSYIYIEDLLNALATSESRRCGTYDVASDDCITVSEVAKIIQEVIGKKVPIGRYPRWHGDADYCFPQSFKLKKTGWTLKFNSKGAVRNAAIALAKEVGV